MKPIQDYINFRLQQRKDANNLRSVGRCNESLIDFSSNDYLGIAQEVAFQKKVFEKIQQLKATSGSTGSRLLTGNSLFAEQLENFIAQVHQTESALLFSSGYDANYGLLTTLPYQDDTIIYDALCHASIYDGIRASKATSAVFNHNNIADLEAKLSTAKGLKYVVVESLYSMNGDLADLEAIAACCEKYEAGLVVDEAHATGIVGSYGEGLVQHLGLEKKCLARIHTFGKALGALGAAVVGSEDLKKFLINYCRPFIFSTAMPAHSLVAIQESYAHFPSLSKQRITLEKLARLFQNSLPKNKLYELLSSNSPIQSLIVKGNTGVKKFSETMQQKGFDVRPILHPTVAKGSERIRICLHSYNTETEVLQLLQAITNYFST